MREGGRVVKRSPRVLLLPHLLSNSLSPSLLFFFSRVVERWWSSRWNRFEEDSRIKCFQASLDEQSRAIMELLNFTTDIRLIRESLKNPSKMINVLAFGTTNKWGHGCVMLPSKMHYIIEQSIVIENRSITLRFIYRWKNIILFISKTRPFTLPPSINLFSATKFLQVIFRIGYP